MTLANLARQAEDRSGFIAGLVARYQQAHNLDDQGLAEFLHCSVDDLVHLKLCMVPRPDYYQQDIETIATHVHADVAALTQVLSQKAKPEES